MVVPEKYAQYHISTQCVLSRMSKHLLLLAGLEIISCEINLLAEIQFLKILKCSSLHFCIN